MKWIGIVLRTLVGAMFVMAGVMVLFNLVDQGPEMEKMPEDVQQYMRLMGGNGYLKVVKVLEIVGGLMLVSGFFVGLGITILTPISVNILLYEVCIAKQPGIGIVMTVLCFVLVGLYCKHFRAAFSMKPLPCCG